MKENYIPQERNSALDGQRKVMYAKNENGNFNRYKYGSKAEEYATKIAVEEYENLKRECLENIKKGISSPIEYFMYKNRMDLPTLSKFVQMFPFRVKRHLKMRYFKRLNDKTLQKYADAFEIDLNVLKDFR